MTSGKTLNTILTVARAGDHNSETNSTLAIDNVPRSGITWRNLTTVG